MWQQFIRQGAPKICYSHFSTLHSKNGKSLVPLSSTPMEDKDMRLVSFLYKIKFCTIFVWSIFPYNRYFWQHSALYWTYFSIPEHYLKNGESLVPRRSTPGEDKDMRPLSFFYRKFNFGQLLIQAFFDIIGTFGSVQP